MTENKPLTTAATPKHAAWEAAVLPLNYSRSDLPEMAYGVDTVWLKPIWDAEPDRLCFKFTTP